MKTSDENKDEYGIPKPVDVPLPKPRDVIVYVIDVDNTPDVTRPLTIKEKKRAIKCIYNTNDLDYEWVYSLLSNGEYNAFDEEGWVIE